MFGGIELEPSWGDIGQLLEADTARVRGTGRGPGASPHPGRAGANTTTRARPRTERKGGVISGHVSIHKNKKKILRIQVDTV